MELHPSFFQLFKNNNIDEGISENFREVLNKCSNPHLICIYGEENFEKNIIINNIINGISINYLNSKEDSNISKEFEENKIKGYNIYGPIKVIDILKKNNIDENQISKDILNDEIFFTEINDLKSIENNNQSLVFNYLTNLFLSSINIIYSQKIDYQKLDEIIKIINLSKILNLKKINEEIKTINLIGEITIKEKEENKIKNEKIVYENKINDFILKNKNDNMKVICHILPSYKLAVNNVGNYPTYYKSEIKDLITTIISNIKNNNESKGNKVIDSLNEITLILKKLNINDEIFKTNDNLLKAIFTGFFKENIDKKYSDIIDKINKFDKNIICLIGKTNLIKKLLIDEIKKELKDKYEIYENVINNEIANILEIYSLKINLIIIENIDKMKNTVKEEINSINDINNNKKVLEYFSNIHYHEEIDTNNIKNIINEEINLIKAKYPLFFECIEEIDKKYKNGILPNPYINISYIKNNNLIFQKPKWEDILNEFIIQVNANIITQYKNKLLDQNSIREIKRELKNNFKQLRKEIDIYTENNNLFIYNKEDYTNKIEELINNLKNELNIQLLILKEKNEKLVQRTIPNGVYSILPINYKNKAIEIKNTSEDNIDFTISEVDNYRGQQFEITYSSINQFYVIKNLYSEKFLSVDYNNNNKIIEIPKHYGNNQQWHIVSIGDNYQIISELNGYPIDISENNNDLNINISCKPNTGELNQQFQFKFCIPSPHNQKSTKPSEQSKYFSKTPYNGCSIVEGLNAIGVNSSYGYREKIAEKNNIEDYAGTPTQNTYMLNLLKDGLLMKP